MTDAQLRERLTRIAARPRAEWNDRLARELPDDPALRMQARLWLQAETVGPALESDPPSLGGAADERYELTVRLAGNASASVWQAYDHRLGRNVAIKVFHADASELVDQVLAEARAASDVVSEHVVRILDVQYGDGHPYLVMELVSEYEPDRGEVVLGSTAAAIAPRDIEEAVRWTMQVARGVAEAHARNVFHRDLKPRNVLVTPNTRRARVADFGLAVSGTSVDGAHPAITLLRRGPTGPVSVRGTPEYMAPEQARGLPLTLDARAAEDRAVLVGIDVWGLGAVAYELLSGRPPWLARAVGDLSAWEVAASTERPPPLLRTAAGERIPRRLRRIVGKALATDPRDRYASAAAFAHELHAYLERRPTTVDRAPLARGVLWVRRNPQLALTALLAMGLTALTLGTHRTVQRLRAERVELGREVGAQKTEQAQLEAQLTRARRALEDTRTKLAAERTSLGALEQTIADERASYAALLATKEEALRSATATTRKILDQLEDVRRERRAADLARTRLERTVMTARQDAEKAAADRDRTRREREAARRERDAAIAERDAIEQELRTLKAQHAREAARASP